MTETGIPLLEVLATWQSETRRLLEPLHPREHPEGVLPSPELAERAAAIRRFRWTVMPRESRKQRFLWPALRKHLYGDTSVVDELADRKQTFEQELIRVRWADERSKHLNRQLRGFIDCVEQYADCEARLLPRIATEVPAEVQDATHSRLTADRRLPVVQPHPDFPATPWVVAMLAPAAAVLDRLRDRFSTTPG